MLLIVDDLVTALKAISALGANLPDETFTELATDRRAPGQLYVEARRIAQAALNGKPLGPAAEGLAELYYPTPKVGGLT